MCKEVSLNYLVNFRKLGMKVTEAKQLPQKTFSES